MSEWLVVRRARAAPVTGIRKRSATRTAGTAMAPAAAHVGIEEAERQHELLDQSRIDVAARAMPVGLIAPSLTSTDRADHVLASAKASGAAWGVRMLGADRSVFDGKGVKVAVIDTGIRSDHSAFAHFAAGVVEEGDFTKQPRGVFGKGVAHDENGHGTHCAATICGGVVDGIRIGVAPNITKLLVAKALGGPRGSAAILDAMDWAASNEVDVISMSIGFDFIKFRDRLMKKGIPEKSATSSALLVYRDNIRVFDAWMRQLRVRRTATFDPIVIAASGNDSDRPDVVLEKVSPSETETIISVGAVDEKMATARFSNANPKFVCPGVDVLSAGIWKELTVMSGTSMACPHAAGVAALYWQAARASGPRATSERVTQMMAASAEKFYGEFGDRPFGEIGDGMPRAPGIDP